jgi:hypothetical protein
MHFVDDGSILINIVDVEFLCNIIENITFTTRMRKSEGCNTDWRFGIKLMTAGSVDASKKTEQAFSFTILLHHHQSNQQYICFGISKLRPHDIFNNLDIEIF